MIHFCVKMWREKLHFTQKWSSYIPNVLFHLESDTQSFFSIMFCPNIVHVFHNHYFFVILFWVSSVHDVFVFTTVLLYAHSSACALSHALDCMCIVGLTLNQCVEVTGGVYRVSWEGDKWGRVFSFVLPLPSCLLYSDTCSQSVQEEAALVG